MNLKRRKKTCLYTNHIANDPNQFKLFNLRQTHNKSNSKSFDQQDSCIGQKRKKKCYKIYKIDVS